MEERWQYQVIRLEKGRDASQVESTLNAAGDDGWELVAIYQSPAADNIFVLKKPKR
jgi:hypothetical protein